MKVILQTDVKKVGRKNDVVDVSKGYALNFLIPQKLAQIATMGALSAVEKRREQELAAESERSEVLRSAIEPLLAGGIELNATVNEKGHLFAAIHDADIAQALTEKSGVEVPESAVSLDADIKESGEYRAHITVGVEVLDLPVTVSAGEEVSAAA
ncbi:MAG: 50S ribosomal protein L9 [Candidatus Paceibacterota bacterium]